MNPRTVREKVAAYELKCANAAIAALARLYPDKRAELEAIACQLNVSLMSGDDNKTGVELNDKEQSNEN